MPPTALAYTFCTESDVQLLLSQDGVLLREDDDNGGTVAGFETGIITQAINYATTRVNFYCQGFYDSSDLATSWLANEWATIVATRWLCSRRGNPVPKSIEEMYTEAIADMQAVKDGNMQIPDIGKRNPDGPVWSNVTFDGRYRYARTRVEKSISEPSATQYAQNVDQNSYFFEI